MKKLKALLLAAACVLGMAGCDNKTVNLDLPFEADEVVSVDMYRYVGAPVSAEKKVIVAEETIKSLYNKFESISYEIKDVEETTGASVTSFRFNLSDGTNYELIYGCYGVKNGNLKSPTGNFEYFTSADIGWNWEFLDSELEAVAAEESELPKLSDGTTPMQQTESKPTVEEVETEENGELPEYLLNDEGEYKYPIKVEETISFHDKTFNKSDLSQETIEWLEKYNQMTEEEQLAISYIPNDLYELCGYDKNGDEVAETE